MGVFFPFFLSSLVAAICTGHPEYGVWEVRPGELFRDAIYPLGQQDFGAITSLNPGVDVNQLYPGDKYTVPYTSDLSAPATWSTSACIPMLHLGKVTSATHTMQTKTTPASHLNTDTEPSLLPTKGPASNRRKKTESTSGSGTGITVATTSLSTTTSRAAQPKKPHATKALPDDHEEDHSSQFCRVDGTYFTDRNTHIRNTKKFCDANAGRTMDRDSDSISTLYEGKGGEIYQYSVSWAQECTLNAKQGFEGCNKIMSDNYAMCNNGGKGGSRRKGCLWFEYRSNWLRDA